MANIVNFFSEDIVLSLLHQRILWMLFKHIKISNKSVSNIMIFLYVAPRLGMTIAMSLSIAVPY
jgi:hypothetical protein